MRTFFFVRHGESEWNAASRMQGQLESDLSELGRRQSDVNGRLLATRGVEALYASPLSRARQSAEIIASHVNLPILCDDRLKEWNCGDWSGHYYDDVKSRWREQWAALQAEPYHYRGPNCENYPDMIARVAPFLEALRGHPARTLAVVSHGIIGRVMISTLLALDERGTLGFRQPNDVVYRVTFAAQRASVDHFIGGEGPFEGVVARS